MIVLDRAVIGDKYTCYIASDPVQIGTLAGRWLAERLQRKGKIVELQGAGRFAVGPRTYARPGGRLAGPRLDHFVFDAYVEPREWYAVEADGQRGTRQRWTLYSPTTTRGWPGRLPGRQGAGPGKRGPLRRRRRACQTRVRPRAARHSMPHLLKPTGGSEAVQAAGKRSHGEKVLKNHAGDSRHQPKIKSPRKMFYVDHEDPSPQRPSGAFDRRLPDPARLQDTVSATSSASPATTCWPSMRCWNS